MFNLFKKTKSKNQESTTLKLSGLHCTSCATNIDLTLEDISGVIDSNTSYQKSEVCINYDPSKTDLKSLKKEIADLGYEVIT